MHEELNFRPTKALLAVWWVGLMGVGFTGAVILSIAVSAQGRLAVGVTAGVLAVLAAAVLAACLTVYFFTIRYTVSNTHVIRSAGFLWKVKRSVPLDKITNIDVRQGPVERALGFGQVWIFTPSTGAMMPEARLTGVVDPHNIRTEILARTETGPAGAPEGPEAAASSLAVPPVVDALREISDTLKRIEQKLDRS